MGSDGVFEGMDRDNVFDPLKGESSWEDKCKVILDNQMAKDRKGKNENLDKKGMDNMALILIEIKE